MQRWRFLTLGKRPEALLELVQTCECFGYRLLDRRKIGRQRARSLSPWPNGTLREASASEFMRNPGIERLGNASGLLFRRVTLADRHMQELPSKVVIWLKDAPAISLSDPGVNVRVGAGKDCV